MEQKNNKQDSIIFEIENLLNKMSNQVNFLIRKDIQMNQLDLDLLMENTRKLYDRLCSVKLGVDADTDTEDTDADFEDADFEDADSDLNIEDEEEMIIIDEEDEENDDEMIIEEDIEGEDNADMVWDFTRINDADIEDTDGDINTESTDFEEDIDDNEDVNEYVNEEIEEVIEKEETEEDNDEDVAIKDEEDSKKDNVPSPITNIYAAQSEEDSGIKTYKIVRENAPTISDKLEQSVDNSLVARLQRKPVTDIISAIGINDKFLFLNELFGGSMEKYNKSIRSLNSFSTLLGAKTYMSELQIEFQWDCDSEAYKKLSDLIERRFL